MNNQAVPGKTYNIPIKELALGGGVMKLLAGAAAPAMPTCPPDSRRAGADMFTVCAYGRGVRRGDVFLPPSISYEDLYGLFDGAPERAYSAKTACFEYRADTGRFLGLEEVVHALYGDRDFSLSEMVSQRPEATVLVASGGNAVRLAAGQLMEEGRYYYPQLTSEQILSGADPADCRGGNRKAGLLRTGSGLRDYKVIFVVGQSNWNDITEPGFIDFADGGVSISIEYLPARRIERNILYIGPLGGRLGENVLAYTGAGSQAVEISAPAGSLVRFNLDNDDFLNQARMYYKFSLDEEVCGDPSPEDGYVYNTRAPLYFGGGADYPSGIILPSSAEHKTLHVKMLAHSDSFADSRVDYFRIGII